MNDKAGMNDLTVTPPDQPLQGYRTRSEAEALSTELAKMLGLVAPVTMSPDQQTLWLASAIDALRDIRASEVSEVSMEVRRTVTRPSQIVPEIAKLVSEKRSRSSRMRQLDTPLIEGPRPKRNVMEHRGEPMSEEETEELNGILEKLGAIARYRSDGSRYLVESSPGARC
jgi:hypothetical protein